MIKTLSNMRFTLTHSHGLCVKTDCLKTSGLKTNSLYRRHTVISIAISPIIALLLLTISLSTNAKPNDITNISSDSLPQLKDFVGKGKLQAKTPTEDHQVDASLVSIQDIVISENTNCNGVQLKQNSKSIFAIVHCESGHYFLCPGGIEHCNKDHFSATKSSKKSFQMTAFENENNYRIEYGGNQLVYRVQEKSCLIPYPHGCLVHGFSWEDEYVYTFNKNSLSKN